MVTDSDYKKTLDGIRSELEDLLNQESEFERRLTETRWRYEALGKAAQALAGLLGEDEEEESVGITDAIREILRSGEHIWQPIAVRNRLQREKFPLEKYQNPLAVIHSTLKRIEGQGEVKAVEHDGKIYYKWIVPEITDDDIPF